MKWNKFIPLISSLQGLLSTHEIFYTQFMGKGETNVPLQAIGGTYHLLLQAVFLFLSRPYSAHLSPLSFAQSAYRLEHSHISSVTLSPKNHLIEKRT